MRDGHRKQGCNAHGNSSTGVNSSMAAERIPHGRLIRLMAKRYRVRGIFEMEDAFQAACVGYLRSMQSYDSARSAETTFGYYYIQRELLSERRRYHPAVVFPQHPAPGVATPAAHSAPISDLGSIERDDDAMLRRTVLRLMATLSPRDEWLMRRRFGFDGDLFGDTLRDLAEDLNVSPQRINQIERKSIKTLRKRWELHSQQEAM